MKSIFHCPIIIFFILHTTLALGGEPQPSRSFIEKARMATHVVVGKMESIKVIDRASGKLVNEPNDTLGDMQCFEAVVILDEIMANDPRHPLRVGARVKIRYGSRKSDTLSNNKLRIDKTRIYWLTQDSEIAVRDNFFFPFYGEAALCELLEHKEEVRAVVSRIATTLK